MWIKLNIWLVYNGAIAIALHTAHTCILTHWHHHTNGLFNIHSGTTNFKLICPEKVSHSAWFMQLPSSSFGICGNICRCADSVSLWLNWYEAMHAISTKPKIINTPVLIAFVVPNAKQNSHIEFSPAFVLCVRKRMTMREGKRELGRESSAWITIISSMPIENLACIIRRSNIVNAQPSKLDCDSDNRTCIRAEMHCRQASIKWMIIIIIETQKSSTRNAKWSETVVCDSLENRN